MIKLAELFVRCERNVLKNLMDYYNSNCFNYVKPSRKYKIQYGDNWCAMFVSVIAHMKGKSCNEFPYEVSVLEQVKISKNLNTYFTDVSQAKCGDLIVFNWNGDYVDDHIGIIKTIADKITTIEGNKGGTVAYRSIALHSPLISGFIRT